MAPKTHWGRFLCPTQSGANWDNGTVPASQPGLGYLGHRNRPRVPRVPGNSPLPKSGLTRWDKETFDKLGDRRLLS